MSVDYFDEQIRPRLPAVRVGRRRVYRIADLQAWLDANVTGVFD